MSQNDQILHHLKQGHMLTAIDALKLFGCFRLAARIKELRDMGYNIITEVVRSCGKKFAGYRLRQEMAA